MFKGIPDTHLYMITAEIFEMEEDGYFKNAYHESCYEVLKSWILAEWVTRGFENIKAVNKKYGHIYDDDHRMYH